MKRIYICAMCAILGATAAQAGRLFTSRIENRPLRIAKISDAVKVMRPASETYYDFQDGQWVEMAGTEFTYDASGNITTELISEDDFISRNDYRYNSDNMIVEQLGTYFDGSEWINDSKRAYRYDPVVKSFCIERLGYSWLNNDWARNYYCETNEVSRNPAGNITSVLKSLPLGDGMYPAYKSEWLYENAGGRANVFNYYVNYTTEGEPEWVLDNATSYRNLKWHKFNGQLTGDDITEYVSGDNLLEQADVYYEDELDGHLLIEYKADGGYLIKETYADPAIVGTSSSLTYTDSYGSFVIEENEYFDEDGQPTATPTYTIRETVTMNERGEVVKDEICETMDGETEIIDGSIFEYEYYADNNVRQVTQMIYDYDSAEYVPMTRIAYGSYVDCAGTGNISQAPQWTLAPDAVSARVEGMTALSLYTLQGVRLLETTARSGEATLSTSTLPGAIYIVKAEGTAASIRYIKK